jgi:hypothetical protein
MSNVNSWDRVIYSSCKDPWFILRRLLGDRLGFRLFHLLDLGAWSELFIDWAL